MHRTLIRYEQKTSVFITKGDRIAAGDRFDADRAENFSVDLVPDPAVDFRSNTGHGTVRIGNRNTEIHYSASPAHTDLLINGFFYRMEKLSGGRGKAGAGEAVELRTEIPGRIVKVLCTVDQVVEAGAALIVQEAMKMELVLKAPARVKIAEILTSEGAQVEADTKLVRFAAPEGQ